MSPDSHNTYSGGVTSNVSSFTNSINQTPTFPDQEVFLPCNNPRNIVSPRATEMVDLVLFAGIFPVLVTYGVITNVINMTVFARQGLSDRINLCLFSLAVSDTGFLLFLMCSKSYAVISLVDPAAGNYWQIRHVDTVLGTCLGFLIISNTTTAVIAVERCICVLSPLKAVRIFRTKHTAILIMAVAVYISMVVTSAFTLRFQTVEVADPITNASTYVIRQSPFYLRHRTLIDFMYNFTLLLTLPTLSLVVVIVCTAFIVVRLKMMATWRRETVSDMTSVEKQDIKVTRMLVTVCIVYVTCTIPSLTRQMAIFSRVPGFMITGYMCNLFKLSIAASHFFEVVNASSNFLIYIQQSSRYQHTLKLLCRKLLNQLWRKRSGKN